MHDLFNGVSHPAAISEIDTFRWVVGVFKGEGAIEVIKRANANNLATYYPIRFNHQGEPTPLWRNYLFVEFNKDVTLQICRTTRKFLKIISGRDENGIVCPILVRRDAIQESMAMILAGKFNERTLVRKFYGRGTIVRILDGIMFDKAARLEMDVTPEMYGNQKVVIDINGVKCKIELFKLAL
jgi:hypothetical protein